ncbi:hypothetical protein OK016_17080 [Vibrio chagasii]|nr:hypothetical protein [Vibrio chagasii]
MAFMAITRQLRQWLMTKFQIDIDARRLVWTHGGRFGISLIIQALSHAKDTILAEKVYCYRIYLCMSSNRTKLVPVKVDVYGLDPEDLAFALSKEA